MEPRQAGIRVQYKAFSGRALLSSGVVVQKRDREFALYTEPDRWGISVVSDRGGVSIVSSLSVVGADRY